MCSIWVKNSFLNFLRLTRSIHDFFDHSTRVKCNFVQQTECCHTNSSWNKLWKSSMRSLTWTFSWLWKKIQTVWKYVNDDISGTVMMLPMRLECQKMCNYITNLFLTVFTLYIGQMNKCVYNVWQCCKWCSFQIP